MLRTRQQLENSKFFQENNKALNLSGSTYLGTYTGKTLSIKNDDIISNAYDTIDTTSLGSSFESVFSFMNGDLLPSNNVRKIIPIDDFTLFFITFGGGLWKADFLFFTPITYNATSGNYDDSEGLIQNNLITGVYLNGHLYLTSSSLFGFTKFNIDSNVAVDYTNLTSNYSGDTLPAIAFTSANVDSDGIHIWFGSSTQGFIKFNTITNVVTRYTSTSGNYTGAALTNNGRDVVSLNGYTWLLTTSALFRMDDQSNVVLYNASSGNYTGDVIPISGAGYLLPIGDELWLSHVSGSLGGYWKLNTLTNVGTRYSNTSGNYSGDVFKLSAINAPIYDSESNTIYGTSISDGISKFDLNIMRNQYTGAISNYVNGNPTTSDRVLYVGTGSNIGSGTFLVGRITASSGVGVVNIFNSTSGIIFSKTGLHYNSEPLSTADTLIPTKKYVDLSAKLPTGEQGSIQLKNNSSFEGSSRFVYDVNNRRFKIHDENNVVTGGTNSTAMGSSVKVQGTYAFGGGSLVGTTGNTSIVYGSTLISVGNYNAIFGRGNESRNNYTFSSGLGNIVTGEYGSTLGRANKAAGSDSFASGTGSAASGSSSAAFNNSKAIGTLSFAQNSGTQAIGNYSHAQNFQSRAYGQSSTAIGTWSVASGNSSFAGGTGFDIKNTLAAGISSFNFSRTSGTQETGHGAIADYSAILGGDDHHIAVGNTRAAIIGGNRIKLTGTSYVDHVAVPSLVLWNTPTGGSSTDRILVYEASSRKVKSITSDSFWKSNGITTITQDTDINLGSTNWNIGEGDGVAVSRDGGAVFGFSSSIAIGYLSATNGNESSIYFSENSISVLGDPLQFTGIQYAYDFADNYSDRSLVDKAYANKPKKRIVENVLGKTLTFNDIGKIFTNSGATGTETYNLPVITSSDIGMTYTFYIVANQNLRVKGNTGQTVRSGGIVTEPAGYLISNTIGNTMTLVAISTTSWVDVALGGTWAAIAP